MRGAPGKPSARARGSICCSAGDGPGVDDTNRRRARPLLGLTRVPSASALLRCRRPVPSASSRRSLWQPRGRGLWDSSLTQLAGGRISHRAADRTEMEDSARIFSQLNTSKGCALHGPLQLVHWGVKAALIDLQRRLLGLPDLLRSICAWQERSSVVSAS